MIKIFNEEVTDERLLFFTRESDYYEKVPINECDFILHNQVLWDPKNTNSILKKISKKYKSIDRFVIVFIVSDEDIKYQFYNNLLIVRTSLKASQKVSNEIVLPFIWECLANPFLPVSGLEKAYIGFCGLTGIYRQNLIDTFKKSSDVNSNFIIRENFWGGSPHDPDVINTFNNNLKDNPFVIAQRGNGNFSMRFYQTLAAGRIPVLVNTDMVLPFQDKIDWHNHIVFENNEQDCLKKVINVFESGNYIQMQKNCSDIFKSYFSSHTYFKQLIDQIFRMFPQ